MTATIDTMIDLILEHVGGSQNIAQCGHCMTRLRLSLHDRSRIDITKLKQIPGVLGVIESQTQLQIVLGPGKAQTTCKKMQARLAATTSTEATASVAPHSDLNTLAATNKQQLRQKQKLGIQQFLSQFATIFTPLIPGFIAAGFMLGIATLLEQTLVTSHTAVAPWLLSLISYLKIFGKGLFTFLPILIGFNTQKVFGGSGVNGAIIGALFILRYQLDGNVSWYAGFDDFFGLTIDPRGNIIGVLLACIVGARIEQALRKIVPNSLDMVLTSTLTLLITGALTYAVIMPIGVQLFHGMSWLFMHLNGNPFGTAVLAGLFLMAVVFGIHQGFVPVYFALIEQQGFNSLFPVLAMAGAGQIGAALALYVKAAPDSLLRKQIKGALFPGFMGIGEPLIYGVTLPRLKPFITACLGGAAGGFFIGLLAYMQVPVGLNTVFGPSGLLAVPLMTSAQGIYVGMAVYCVATLIAWIAGFILTWLFGCKNVDLQ